MLPSFHFEHSYLNLPSRLYSRVNPTPVEAPELLLFNKELADKLCIHFADSSDDELARVFTGSVLPEGAKPLAQAYAGHQFGHFTVLGDGRAVLLGEQINDAGERFDIQFKGSGPTPYSRRGDGRATLGSMLREYLISEAIYHLGIPGSRSLAVALTGETVLRNGPEPGAVLTRVMSSHLRVGTFEYARQFLTEADLRSLADYAIARHYPHLAAADNTAYALLEAVMEKQIALVCGWMRVGFIHGVMNTDNTHIGGESFDFGPCAFMNAYHPRTVFSSIDRDGRYAFGQQPHIAQWNMGVFAGTLLPLLHQDEAQAIEMARDLLSAFPVRFRKSKERMLAGKLGFASPRPGDAALAEQLLNWMQESGADYTNTFLALAEEALPEAGVYADAGFAAFRQKWLSRAKQEDGGVEAARAHMGRHNPRFIPRNHLVEEALTSAAEAGDFGPFEALLGILSDPYSPRPGAERYQSAPPQGDTHYQTFCGT